MAADPAVRRRRGEPAAWPVALAVVAAATLAARLFTLPPGLEDFDSVYFARALDRYAVAESRPHFPGYPVYVWVGRLARALVPDPVVALHVVSAVASTLALVPLALLAAAWRREAGGTARESTASGLTAALLWAVVPLSWITAGEIYSDALGLLLALGALLLVWESGRRAGPWTPVAGLVAGLTLGARLADAGLLAPLAERVWGPTAGEAAPRKGRRLIRLLGGLAAGVLPWAAWQLWMEGPRFLAAGRRHVTGHFTTWGNTAAMDSEPLGRLTRLVSTQTVYGLGGGFAGPVRVAVTACVVALAVVGAVRLWRVARVRWLVLLWTVPYLAEVLAALDIRHLRYGLPLVAMLVVVAAVGLPRARIGMAAALLLPAMVLSVSAPLAWRHHRLPATEAQAASFAATLDPTRSAVLTPELGPRIIVFLEYLAPGLPLVSAEPDAVGASAAALAAQGRTVYAGVPAPDRPEDWSPVARFCRPGGLDPLSPADIWIFRYQPGEPPGPPPGCRSR